MLVTVLALWIISSPPDVKPLAHAYRDGLVRVTARSHASYSIAELQIRNHRTAAVSVDVNGSYLEPQVRSIQRLGMGLLRAGDHETSLTLAPGEKKRIRILSVCMDGPRSAPRRGTRFRLAKKLAPPATLRVLRQWKEHPHIPQGEIQSAVWGGRPARVRERPPAIRRPTLLDKAAKILPFDRGLLVLKEDGGLVFGRDLDRLRSVPGTVTDICTVDEAYAIRKTIGKGRTDVLKTVCSRFDTETLGWSDLPLAMEPGKLRWVRRDGAEALVLRPSGELVRVNATGATAIIQNVKLLEVSRGGRILWVTRGEPEVLFLTDMKQKGVNRYTYGVPIIDLACVKDDLYALDNRKYLIFFDVKRPRRLRGEVSFIDAMGPHLLAGSTEEWNALLPLPGRLHYYRAGKAVASFPYPERFARPAGKQRYLYDPLGDLLFAYDGKDTLQRFNPVTGLWADVTVAEATMSKQE